EIGIGLNSGNVVVGNIGGGGRLEFSVIGDAVNVAARIEAATRATGDGILVSGTTKEWLNDSAIRLLEREGITLKGKREPVSIFAVVSGA
ncbi:MAG: adenylate/guanylate cyclase domain-containing protein, partial [Actinomycetota bacterium]